MDLGQMKKLHRLRRAMVKAGVIEVQLISDHTLQEWLHATQQIIYMSAETGTSAGVNFGITAKALQKPLAEAPHD